MAISPTKNDPVDLSIVVLAWNGLDHTKRCVESIRDSTHIAYELIIVDNGSADEAADWASDVADVAILNSSNIGFARGMNTGLSAASGTAIAFVNNDTIMPPRWASHLLETLHDEDLNAGIVVPAVTNAGNASTVRSTTSDSVHATRPFRDLPSGVVYVMETATIRQLGGWNERYPIASAEDLDMLFTVWSNGLEVVLDERVLVDHVGGATANHQLKNKGRIWRENRQLFVERWRDIVDEDVPRVSNPNEGNRQGRLTQARIAAWWMSRFFVADDAFAVEKAQARTPAEDSQQTPPSTRDEFEARWRRFLRLIAGRPHESD